MDCLEVTLNMVVEVVAVVVLVTRIWVEKVAVLYSEQEEVAVLMNKGHTIIA
jgi:hypothetical protein